MRQAVMTSPGKIEFRRVEKPEPKAGEVLIRIQRIGVCGVIAEVGKAVRGLNPGDPVVFMPQVT